MSQESAFKPYHKFSVGEKLEELPDDFDKSIHPSSSTIGDSLSADSPQSSQSQVKPFDYSVEKLLKPPASLLSPNMDMRISQSSSLLDLAKWSSIPISLIASHLWWQTQTQKSSSQVSTGLSAVSEVTSVDYRSTSASAMCEFTSNDTLCFRSG